MIFWSGFSGDFFDKSKHSALIDRLISELPAGNLTSQLATRRIKKIVIVPELRSSGGKVILGTLKHNQKKPDEFCILLLRNQNRRIPWARMTEYLLTIGHEIAHTYFYGPIKRQDLETGGWMIGMTRQYISCDDEGEASFLEEWFCEEFARKWAKLCGNQRELREMLQTALSTSNKKQSRVVVEVKLEALDLATLRDDTVRLPTFPPLTPEEEAALPF